MIELNKKKLDKKHIALIATSGILILLIVGYIILSAVINATNTSSGGTGNSAGTPQYDPEIGEALYMNSPAAYPYVSKAQIQSITIASHEDTYTMMRPTDKDGKALSYFLFYYKDEDGMLRAYMPDITGAESGFDYTDLYAIETGDGLNVEKIEYLIASLGILYYDYKVPLKEGVAERKNQLALYGLGDGEGESILISYVENGEEKQHKIVVGDSLISGYGYYFMIDDRDYIYSSTSAGNLSYALAPFESIINSRVVAAGLASDKTFEPYLTTDYVQWKNSYFDFYLDENGNEQPYRVTADSEVIFNANILTPVYDKEGSCDDDGYSRVTDRISLNLGEAKKDPAISRLVAALAGRTVDKDGISSEKKTVTVINGQNAATLWDAEKGTGKYTYTIRKIESVLTDTDEYFSGAVLGHNLIKVSYDYAIDGVAQNAKLAHAVINLDTASVIPAELKNIILSSSVGDELNYTFDVRHTDDNSKKMTVTYVITQISLICEIVDEEPVYLEKVGENSIVSFSFHTVAKEADGTETVSETYDNQLVSLSEITDGYNLDIKNALLGKTVGTVNIEVPIGEVHYQHFDDFVSYEVSGVVGFVERELVTAFRFANESERDPFYAETSYKNTIAEFDPSNPHAIYALEVESCDEAVRALGGISMDGSSTSSVGLVGLETVAVGITPEIMKEYKLYEGHTIYFELPRGITADSNNADDYAWASELGFNIYISNPVHDEKYGTVRYVASDMYDIVVKVESSAFDYLDEPFADFWARRNLAMVNHTDIDEVGIKFNFPDLVGDYTLRLEHSEHPSPDVQNYDFLTVYASINGFVKGESAVEGVYDETGLSKLLAYHGKTEFALHELYNHLYLDSDLDSDGYLSIEYDYMGSSYFKEWLVIIFGSYYMGTVDVESEEIKALLREDALMTISFDVSSSSAMNNYVYEFRRLDDRRIVVSFFLEDINGARTPAVSDLYITDLNFNKIVNGMLSLFNADAVEPDVGY